MNRQCPRRSRSPACPAYRAQACLAFTADAAQRARRQDAFAGAAATQIHVDARLSGLSRENDASYISVGDQPNASPAWRHFVMSWRAEDGREQKPYFVGPHVLRRANASMFWAGSLSRSIRPDG